MRPTRTTTPTDHAPESDVRLRWRWLAVAAFAVGLAWTGWIVWHDREPRLRHPAIVATAYTAFGLWAGAVGLMLQAKLGEWAPTAARFRVTQWTWALACLMYLIHVAVAFHFAHRWQHANAYRHVEETSHFGPGIYVSYFFTLFWAVDAAWFGIAPTSYASRPRWLGRTVHGFITFVVFNGTAVFGHNPLRWVAAAVFVVLGGYWVMKLREKPIERKSSLGGSFRRS